MATASHTPRSAVKDFQMLAAIWKAETKLLSNVTKRAIHPAYQRIIGMGEAAVPLILEDLAINGPDDWFWALTAITGHNPITEEMAGNMDAMTEAWLRWGASMGYRNGSNRTTNASSPISPQHAAKLEGDGQWSSKLGSIEDIEHRTEHCFRGSLYGDVACYMRRKK